MEFVAFIMVGVAAFVTLLQSWLSHGRPPYGTCWLAYAGSPVVVTILVIGLTDEWPAKQGLVDLINGASFYLLALGYARFFGTTVPRGTLPLLFGLGAISGAAYALYPATVVARNSGSLVFISGFLIARLLVRHSGSHEARGARALLTVGVAVSGPAFWQAFSLCCCFRMSPSL